MIEKRPVSLLIFFISPGNVLLSQGLAQDVLTSALPQDVAQLAEVPYYYSSALRSLTSVF
jgi:hypothetical protein